MSAAETEPIDDEILLGATIFAHADGEAIVVPWEDVGDLHIPTVPRTALMELADA